MAPLIPAFFRAGAFLALGAVVSACGGSKKAAADPVGAATQRLQGPWRVKNFTPESQLDAPLQSLLNAQLGALTVTFSGSEYVAQGPGIDVRGQYKIWSFANDRLSGTLYDPTNVAYRIAGQFQGAAFDFQSFDSTWKGQGRLER